MLSWNNNVSSALLLRENVNEAVSSANLPKKMQSILFQNSSFFKMKQVESDTSENLGQARSGMYQSTN